MEPADLRHRHDIALFWWLDSALVGRVLLESEMIARAGALPRYRGTALFRSPALPSSAGSSGADQPAAVPRPPAAQGGNRIPARPAAQGEESVSAEGPSDHDLVAAYLARRDEASFRRLYRRHAPALYSFAVRALSGSGRDAEEVVHDTWIRACERLAAFRWESGLATWLCSIALNRCRELRRERARETGIAPPPEPGSPATAGAGEDASPRPPACTHVAATRTLFPTARGSSQRRRSRAEPRRYGSSRASRRACVASSLRASAAGCSSFTYFA